DSVAALQLCLARKNLTKAGELLENCLPTQATYDISFNAGRVGLTLVDARLAEWYERHQEVVRGWTDPKRQEPESRIQLLKMIVALMEGRFELEGGELSKAARALEGVRIIPAHEYLRQIV